jgi:phosphatidylglycerol---prolipoprotein diacylglyceryl transferase
MLPILQIGPLALQTPGLVLLVGVWLALVVADRSSRQNHFPPNTLENLVLTGLLAFLVGGRAGYVIQYFSIFFDNPLSIISLTPTMFHLEAGLAAGLIAAFIFGQRKSLRLWSTLDALTPAFGVFFVALHLANFASGDAYGSPATLPWAIQLWGDFRHPTQIYEMIAALFIVIVLLIQKDYSRKPGTDFWAFVAATAFARLFFDFFRGDASTILWNIHQAQIIAWMILAIALWQLKHRILLEGSQIKPIDT